MVLRVGELMQINPAKVHKIQYQEYIDNILDNIAEEKNDMDLAYFNKYGTTMNVTKYKIQLRKYKIEMEMNNVKIATETLAIYALKSHTRMAQELMKWVAPLSNDYPNAVKFVPTLLATDKTI
eukprot:9727679-Ditylum_brightwellii.AAC.1